MWKLGACLGALLTACLYSSCARPISKVQAAELLQSNHEFVSAGSRHRQLLAIKWTTRSTPDEPYNYDAGFLWKWNFARKQGESLVFESIAEFALEDDRWTLKSFTDENHRLVQIGSDIHEGPPPRIARPWDKLSIRLGDSKK